MNPAMQVNSTRVGFRLRSLRKPQGFEKGHGRDSNNFGLCALTADELELPLGIGFEEPEDMPAPPTCSMAAPIPATAAGPLQLELLSIQRCACTAASALQHC
jgi:hypothetical protein